MAVATRACVGEYYTDEARLVRVTAVGPNGGVLVEDARNDDPLSISRRELGMLWRPVVPKADDDA